VCYSVRMNVRTNLLLPQELVEAVDEVAGPRGRSRYVARAVERQLRRDRQVDAFEATFGTLTASDYPQWSTPEAVVSWVRERRAETTDPDL
jgi:metal-responsive CopG/Arc/MetJ family transcriptional regulator